MAIKFWCREKDQVESGSLTIPSDWTSRAAGALTVTDDDKRGAPAGIKLDKFSLKCGANTYDLEKDIGTGKPLLKIAGKNYRFDPNEDIHVYIKDGEFSNYSSEEEFKKAVTKVIDGDYWLRGRIGLGGGGLFDRTTGVLPSSLPDDYDTPVQQPDQPVFGGMTLSTGVDMFLPFIDKAGKTTWARYMPLFYTANLNWAVGGSPGEDLMGFSGEEGSLWTGTVSILGLGLSAHRIYHAFNAPAEDDTGVAFDAFVRTDFLGLRSLRIDSNVTGQAPAVNTEDTALMTVGNTPNVTAGLDWRLSKYVGFQLVYDWRKYNNIPDGRGSLEIHSVAGFLSLYAPDESREDLTYGLVNVPLMITPVPAPQPTPAPVAIAAAPPPAPAPTPKALLDFRPVDVPTSARSEANASTTFVTGNKNLLGSATDPTRNDGVQAIVTAMEDYVKSLEEIGLKDVTFDVDLLAGADFASGAAYNKKLSNERSESFISGSTSKDKTQVNGLEKALADSPALRTSGARIQNITPRGVGESMPVAYHICSENYIKNIRGQKAKNEALIREVAETISNIKSNADSVPSEVIVKDKSPSGPFFASDGTAIKGTYETPAIQNGGYGIFKEAGNYYLVNYQASRRVLAKMRATKVPAFEIAGASSPTMDDKTVGEFTFHNMPITNANGIELTPNPLSGADLSNFVGAILKVAGTVQHGKKLVVQIALPKAKLDSMGDDAVNKIAKYLGVASTVKGKLPVEVIIAKDTDTATMEKDRIVLSVVDASLQTSDTNFKEALSEALLMK